MAKPTQADLKRSKKYAGYLKGTLEEGVWLPAEDHGSNEDEMEGYGNLGSDGSGSSGVFKNSHFLRWEGVGVEKVGEG